ncbi:MAG: filamentous hemagglutinin N-terminal domain-containing protein [Pseudomonadaceae bacterium]
MTRKHHAFAPTALALAISLVTAHLHAADLPTGGNIVGGSGSISQDGNSLNVQQNSDKLITDWNSFDIGAGNTVNFYQPGKDSVALNRVIGEDASAIYGNLNANGKVFLVNPNGVLFGKGAAVNVGALVASTLSLSNEDFNDGNYQFQGDGNNAAVINHGRINADQGAVALLGGQVSNHGIIQANQGTVALAAGDKITLDFAGDGLLNVTVDEGTIDALVENHQLIRANGGQVVMTANATNALLQTVVNNTGIIEAQTLENQSGTIVLKGGFNGGTVNVAGTLDASAPDSGDGGFIDTSGANVKVAGGTHVTTKANNGTTGEWLIDPTDFTISAGSEALSDSGIGADTLSDSLSRNNVTLETPDAGTEAGDLYVNGAVSWDANTTLSLDAHNDIHINEAITGTNGGLTLNAGGEISADGAVNVGTFNLQSGDWTQLGSTLADFSARDFRLNTANASFLRATSGDGSEGNAYRIFDIYGLQGMASRRLLSSHVALTNDIDASGTANWNGGAGFVPIGDWDNRYTGDFDGGGHIIYGLTINRAGANYVGLFGVVDSSHISHIGLQNASILGRYDVGGLVGRGVNAGQISHSYVQGSITGSYRSGGLAGDFSGTIDQSYSTGTVDIGYNSYAGGLVGDMVGQITDSYSTAVVEGGSGVGGLVGLMNGSISRSYATGSVQGSNNYVGGLVGEISGSGISDSYATGNVIGQRYTGGLVGESHATISRSYATGRVSGPAGQTGALVGLNSGTLTDNYWNTETSGQAGAVGDGSDDGTTGLTTAQMFDAANFLGFDFADIWANADDQTTPYLRALAGNRVFNKNDLPAGTIDATNRPALYTVIQNVEQLQAMRNNLTLNYLLGNHIDASATAGWNGGAGFASVGTGADAFTGVLDGMNHVIDGLTINSNSQYVGLFGRTLNASIRNLGLVNASISGTASGNIDVGALVGWQQGGTVTQSFVAGSVSGISTANDAAVGGLVGRLTDSGNISESYFNGAVSGSSGSGFTRTLLVGGLVGGLTGSSIYQSYANSTVSGASSNYNSFLGGLVGYWFNGGGITQSFWNTDTSGLTSGTGSRSAGTGLTTEQSMQADSFAGWDIDAQGGTGSVWRIYEGYSAPLLRRFLTTLSVNGDDIRSTYDGTEQSGSWSASGQYDADRIHGQAIGGRNAGTYNLDMSGLYSDQLGYDLITTDGTLTIERKAITGNITAGDKTYDGTRDAVTGGTLDGVIAGDDIAFDTEGSFADKNAGDDKQVDVSGSLSGTDAGNYVLTTNDTTTADIDRKVITADIRALDKLFDGSLAAILEGVLNGTISGDDVELQMSGLFASLELGENSVSIDASLIGADAGNYELIAPDSATASLLGFVGTQDYQSAIVSQPPQPRQLNAPGDAGYQLSVDEDALNLPTASR